MKNLFYKLMSDNTRPVIEMDLGGTSIDVLFDSGASIPVWTSGIDLFNDAFGENNLGLEREEKAEFGGFGGKVEADVYRVNLFLPNGLYFPNMLILVYDYIGLDMPDLILGWGMFYGMIVNINMLDKSFKTISFEIRDNDSWIRNLKFSFKGKQVVCTLIDNIDSSDSEIRDNAAMFNKMYEGLRSNV